MLLVTSVIFLLSTLGCAFAVNYTTFVVFRMIAGVSVGAASMLSPLYISEIAPAHLRGRMVSLNQFAIFSRGRRWPSFRTICWSMSAAWTTGGGCWA